MVVSKSITHNTFPSLSNNMLDTFVSQWQIRFGSFPSRYRRSAAHISSASFSISSTSDCTFSIRPAAFCATASRNCCIRNSILWKSGMVSPNFSGRSASMASNSPNFTPTRYEDSGVTASSVCDSGMNTHTRQ